MLSVLQLLRIICVSNEFSNYITHEKEIQCECPRNANTTDFQEENKYSILFIFMCSVHQFDGSVRKKQHLLFVQHANKVEIWDRSFSKKHTSGIFNIYIRMMKIWYLKRRKRFTERYTYEKFAKIYRKIRHSLISSAMRWNIMLLSSLEL